MKLAAKGLQWVNSWVIAIIRKPLLSLPIVAGRARLVADSCPPQIFERWSKGVFGMGFGKPNSLQRRAHRQSWRHEQA